MSHDADRPDVARPAERMPAPPPSTSSTKALIGILLAGTAGIVIFLFVHLSKDGGIRPGVGVGMGPGDWRSSTGIPGSHRSSSSPRGPFAVPRSVIA